MLSAAGMYLLPCWVSRSNQGVCMAFAAATAVLMAMFCKSKRIAAAALVELLELVFNKSCCFSVLCFSVCVGGRWRVFRLIWNYMGDDFQLRCYDLYIYSVGFKACAQAHAVRTYVLFLIRLAVFHGCWMQQDLSAAKSIFNHFIQCDTTHQASIMEGILCSIHSQRFGFMLTCECVVLL